MAFDRRGRCLGFLANATGWISRRISGDILIGFPWLR
jgi:hypothetical protein